MINWETGINICASYYIYRTDNCGDLLNSIGNSTECYIITYMGKES